MSNIRELEIGQLDLISGGCVRTCPKAERSLSPTEETSGGGSGGGGGISFGDAVTAGSFAGGTGAAASGATITVVGSAALAGGLILGAGYLGYRAGEYINDNYNIGGAIYDILH